MLLHCIYILFSYQWALVCFHLLTILNNATVNMGIQMFVQVSALSFFSFPNCVKI